MATIEKKIWPEFFKEAKKGRKRVEIRLADFHIEEGDNLLLKEWNPKKKEFTGRKVKFKVKKLYKIPDDIIIFYPLRLIKKYGVYILELEKVK
jgi:hypothetical protein